jgi:hypothetical protein
MTLQEAGERRDAFIADLVEVCKKHRVMFEPDGSDWEGLDPIDIMLSEFRDDVNLVFHVGLEDIEAAVRAGVWPCVHPVGEFDRADELDGE